MSSQNKERIKGLHIKDSPNSYSNLIPFGSEGELIDMLSTLDLEQELKIGGNHYIEIKEENDETIVKEWYYTEPKNQRSKIQMSNFCTFSVSTTFTERPALTAIEVGENNQVLSETEDGNIIVIEDDNKQSIIEMSLYKGDLETNGTLIHTKTIIIDPPNSENVEIATEELEGGE